MNTNDIKVVKRAIGDFHFSILIPTWNNIDYLKLCINSIEKNSTFKHQIIVHINEGTDGSLDWVHSKENIDYTCSKENIGVCYALNIASSIASTEYIAYVNDDMYLCPGWDDALLKEIQLYGRKDFFFSATTIERAGTSDCVIEKDYGENIETFKEQALLNEYKQLHKDDWMGATWPPNIVHKDLWSLVGGYSIEFSPGMYSDPDFSMKLWKASVRMFKGVSASRAYHFTSRSTKRIKKNKGYYEFISKWQLTSRTFTDYILKRGQKFTGKTEEMRMPFAYKLKNKFKQVITLFKKIN
jgi:glycosyltransferase involved in cell wall biosynthesis